MKKIIICVIFTLLLSISLFGADKETLYNVVVKGTAAINGTDIPRARDEAILDAQVKAIEEVIGVFITDETVIKDFALFSKNTIKQSSGFIKKYDVVDEQKETLGGISVYSVTIKAEIFSGKIYSSISDMKNLYSKIDKPKFSILIEETNNIGARMFDEIDSKIINKLKEMNFDVEIVDRAMIKLTNNGNLFNTLKDNGVKILINVAADTNVNTNTIKSKIIDLDLNAAQCSLSATFVDLSDGTPYYTNSVIGHSAIAGTNAVGMAANAAKNAVDKFYSPKNIDRLKEELCNKWVELSNYHTYTFSISGMRFSDINKFVNELKAADRFFIKSGKPKLKDRKAYFTITTRTASDYFLDLISEIKIDGKSIELTEVDFDREIIEAVLE